MPGWKQNVVHGRTIWVLHQSASWACGVCCAAMALSWKGHGRPTEKMMGWESQSSSDAVNRYAPAKSDRADMAPSYWLGQTPTVAATVVLRAPGTMAQGVTDLLNGYDRIVATLAQNPTGTACKNACRNTADDGSRPVIIGLVTPPHFVICHSHISQTMGATIHLIGDPGYGDVVEGHITESGGQPYLGTTGGRYGTIIDEMIVLN
jgi:hypothetical protein